MTISEIKKQFENIQSELKSIIEEFPWEDKAAYISWLTQTMEYATHTTRILALTGAHFPLDKTPLASRFIAHATEEKGHDKLLVNDCKALGSDISRNPLFSESEAFHKSLYYWIYQGRTPVIMGWVILLEGFAVRCGDYIYSRVEKAYPKSATSFVRVHSVEDKDHIEKAFEALSFFSEAELKDVAHGLELYSKLYQNIYRAIVEDSSRKKMAA